MSQLPELDEVQENFNMGIICAQQVLAHFADRLDLPEETADTLSGLVFSLLGRPPVQGDEVSLDDVVIRVETMEDLGVGELSLLLPASDADTHFTEWDMADHE